MAADRRRQTREETRQQLLAAASELLFEQGFSSRIDLKVEDVVRRARRTKGAAYNIWPRQIDFQRDLAAHLLTTATWADTSVVADAVIDLAVAGEPLQELVRVGCRAYLEHICRSREFYLLTHFWAVAYHDHTVRELLADSYETFHKPFAELYGIVIDACGLEMRPPYTVDELTTTVTALVEGFAMRNLSQPERVRRDLLVDYDDGTRREWDLFSAAVDGVVTEFTRDKT